MSIMNIKRKGDRNNNTTNGVQEEVYNNNNKSSKIEVKGCFWHAYT